MLSAYGRSPRSFLPVPRWRRSYGLSREGVERCWQLHRTAAPHRSRLRHLVAQRRWPISPAAAPTSSWLDHHEPGAQARKAERTGLLALVNPKTGGDGAFSYLCSVGLVFKLCHALLKTSPLESFDLRGRLDLVALGTVADIVPLEGENRIPGLSRRTRARADGDC